MQHGNEGAFPTRAHVFAQIHGCSSRHNATAVLASYEHFLRTQAQRIRLWTPQLQQYCRSRSSKCAYIRGASFVPSLPPALMLPTAPSFRSQPASCTDAPLRPSYLFFSLTSALSHSRDVIAACIFYETDRVPSHCRQPAIHPSHDGSVCPSTATLIQPCTFRDRVKRLIHGPTILLPLPCSSFNIHPRAFEDCNIRECVR